MLSLRDLQMDFQNYLIKENPIIEKEILSTRKLSAKTRLDIYREGYYLRLIEVLSHDYEILHTLLGDEQFDTLARKYIDAHPSVFRSVRWFGRNLPEFIQKNMPHPLQPFLVELALFEWLLTESFDTKNCTPLTLEEMAAIPADLWPNVSFSLHPSLKQLKVHWNILQIWNAITNTQEMISPQILAKEIHIIIWRKELETQFYSLSEEKQMMLHLIEEKHPFATICEKLCEWHDENEVGMHAALLLKELIIDGIITGVSFPQTD